MPLTRRRMRFRVHPDMLLRMLTTGNVHTVVNGIPPGARVVGWRSDSTLGPDHLELFVEHPSFPEAQEGMEAPLGSDIEMSLGASPDALANVAFDFVGETNSDTPEPVYLVTTPPRLSQEQVQQIERSFRDSSLRGSVMLLPNDMTVSRIE